LHYVKLMILTLTLLPISVLADQRNSLILDSLVEELKDDCAADVDSGTVLGEPIISGVSLEKDNYFSLTPEAIAYFEDSETGAEIIILRPAETICAEQTMHSGWCGASAGCNCTEISEGKTIDHFGHEYCQHEGHFKLLPAEKRRLEMQKAKDKKN
jgi:hypothetical protein